MPKRGKLNSSFDDITQTQDDVSVEESPSFDLLQVVADLRSGTKLAEDKSKVEKVSTPDNSKVDNVNIGFDLIQEVLNLRNGNKSRKDKSKADNIPTQDSSLSDRLESLNQDLAQKTVALRVQAKLFWRNKI
jgi:hypothetical protein